MQGNLVYVIDFGLAKKFRDQRTHQHIPYRYIIIEIKSFTQTPIFLSQSRRLKSFGLSRNSFNPGLRRPTLTTIATNLTSICCVYKEKIVKDVSYRTI